MRSAFANGSALAGWLEQTPREGAIADLLRGPTMSLMPRKSPKGRRLRVLMSLCQKMEATGSGIVMREMLDGAVDAGIEYAVLSGGYEGDALPSPFSEEPTRFEVLPFESAEGLPFPIPG